MSVFAESMTVGFLIGIFVIGYQCRKILHEILDTLKNMNERMK